MRPARRPQPMGCRRVVGIRIWRRSLAGGVVNRWNAIARSAGESTLASAPNSQASQNSSAWATRTILPVTRAAVPHRATRRDGELGLPPIRFMLPHNGVNREKFSTFPRKSRIFCTTSNSPAAAVPAGFVGNLSECVPTKV